MIDSSVCEIEPLVGTAGACRALGASRASVYRRRNPPRVREHRPRPTPSRALTAPQRTAVSEQLNSERFMDSSPAQVWATLLDEGTYLCSQRTMYRILAADDQVRERRQQRAHPPYTRPELLAQAPNEVWSWDITKLLGPAKWSYYYLYVILDVFSRYVVGWTVQARETGPIAQQLIAHTLEKQQIKRGQLTIHADRGTSMTSKPVAFLLADLGVTKSHNRPYTSTDNPYSEAHFKTLKYRPGFPTRFDSIEHARAFCRPFFDWYNSEHRHSGIGLLTPAPSTTAVPRPPTTHAPKCSPPPTPPHLSGSSTSRRSRQQVPTAAWINKPDEQEIEH